MISAIDNRLREKSEIKIGNIDDISQIYRYRTDKSTKFRL